MESRINYTKSIFILLLFTGIAGMAAILKLTATFILPIIAAMLLAFVFYPLCKFLNRRLHIPWILSISLLLLATLVLFFLIGNLLVTSTKAIIGELPKYESRFTTLYKLFCSTFRIEFDENSSLMANLWNLLNVRTVVQNAAISLSGWLMSTGKVVLIIALFVVFLLIEMRTLHAKIDSAFPEESVRRKILAISANIIHVVTHYISIKFFISLVTGFLVFLATFVIGMDFPIVWGFIAFVLNFIPTFGSIISWGITTLFALLQFGPQWGYVIYVGITVLAINTILGSIIEPRWEGSDLGLSPFVILVCLSFWGWMWSFTGMVLAVPLTVIIKIIFENIPLLRPIAILIGTKRAAERENDV